MKKLRYLFAVACMICLCCVSSAALAAAGMLPINRVAIGGIGPNCTEGYVYQTYGSPNNIAPRGLDSSVWHLYGSFMKICYWGEAWTNNNSVDGTGVENPLRHIEIWGNSSMKTPDGIGLGMNINQVLSTYGTPGRIVQNKNNNTVDYFYWCGQNANLRFVAANNRIVRMSIHVTD